MSGGSSVPGEADRKSRSSQIGGHSHCRCAMKLGRTKMAIISGCKCPNCGTFIAPRIPPSDKKSLSSASRAWHLVCHKCPNEFDIPESRLDFISVSEEWLQEYDSLDLEAMILAPNSTL